MSSGGTREEQLRQATGRPKQTLTAAQSARCTQEPGQQCPVSFNKSSTFDHALQRGCPSTTTCHQRPKPPRCQNGRERELHLKPNLDPNPDKEMQCSAPQSGTQEIPGRVPISQVGKESFILAWRRVRATLSCHTLLLRVHLKDQ